MKIDKGIPIPERRGLWANIEMDKGDSFLVQGKTSAQCHVKLSVLKRRGWKFAIRKDGNGVRIWRIK
jgi:hypothetical protein